jgi:hypothetical protein
MWPELLPQLCNLLNSEDYNTCEVGDIRGPPKQGPGLGVGLHSSLCPGVRREPLEPCRRSVRTPLSFWTVTPSTGR